MPGYTASISNKRVRASKHHEMEKRNKFYNKEKKKLTQIYLQHTKL